MQRPRPERFSLKETNPRLGSLKVTGDKDASAYDLVEEMQYLYVRVVKAKNLPRKDVSGSCDPYVEVKLGNFVAKTGDFKKKSKSDPEWNEVFAIGFDRFRSSELLELPEHPKLMVDVKDNLDDNFRAGVVIELNGVPIRVPPNSPVEPKWHRLDHHSGELMLAVWEGVQTDEVFPRVIGTVRSNVYLFPKLRYLRVDVIEAQDLQPSDECGSWKVFVKATLGNQVLRTMISQSRTNNPVWNKDLMFVVAEPIAEPPLILSIEDKVESNKDEVLGTCVIPFQYVDRRLDGKPVNTRWYNLEKHVIAEGEGEQRKKDTKFAGRIHVRIWFEGGYHVLEESPHHSSDLRPATEPLWNSSIGVLGLGILNAQGLMPMKTKDGRQRMDAYCVAKYGQKWVRTRTILDSLEPKWNEQYKWEVFDPCTVITIGVFDNSNLNRRHKSGGGEKDLIIGKVRIPLSTLETNRVYTHLYPLLVLHPSGVKNVGEIHLALRFTCSSLPNMMHIYSQPLLPKIHYLHPLTVSEDERLRLRHEASQIVLMGFSVADPPLRNEVMEYMLDAGSQMWSMRNSKANFDRIIRVLSGLIAVKRWFDQVCNWKNPLTTVLIHILFIILIVYPGLILPAIFLNHLLILVWKYIKRSRDPSHIDIDLSRLLDADPDELDEEFDTLPTSQSSDDIVRMRYDRLRVCAGRVQAVFGDLATRGERLQSLLSFQDPIASTVYLIFCLIASIVLWVTPFRVVVLLAGFYMFRHPRFRYKLPSVPLNFFNRLPASTDRLL